MERARFLLGFSDLKVAEIALRLRFSDTEYFRKMFKSYTGIAPAKFDYEAYVCRTVGETESEEQAGPEGVP